MFGLFPTFWKSEIRVSSLCYVEPMREDLQVSVTVFSSDRQWQDVIHVETDSKALLNTVPPSVDLADFFAVEHRRNRISLGGSTGCFFGPAKIRVPFVVGSKIVSEILLCFFFVFRS